uniref:Uncharacterized protein n=1 Tax=Anguilla anguilla TaxID=7936 RepID=A0A0E9SD45_ANGAN
METKSLFFVLLFNKYAYIVLTELFSTYIFFKKKHR